MALLQKPEDGVLIAIETMRLQSPNCWQHFVHFFTGPQYCRITLKKCGGVVKFVEFTETASDQEGKPKVASNGHL